MKLVCAFLYRFRSVNIFFRELAFHWIHFLFSWLSQMAFGVDCTASLRFNFTL